MSATTLDTTATDGHGPIFFASGWDAPIASIDSGGIDENARARCGQNTGQPR